MDQEELFDIISDNQAKYDCLLRNIRETAQRIVAELEYPEGCIELFERKNKTGTNHQIHILELKKNTVDEEQANKATAKKATAKKAKEEDDEEDGDGVAIRDTNGVRLSYHCTSIITLAQTKPRSKFAGCAELRISVPTYNTFTLPKAEAVKERWVAKKDENEKKTGKKYLARYDVLVRLDSDELLPYLEMLMRYRLSNYKSKEPTYGCCHLYNECSDARKCISKDKMYATVCAYKKNLDAGKIFYGRNRNV